jgi:hypothetical protein
LSCNPIDKKISGSGYHGLFLQKKLHTNCDITAWMLSRNIRKSFWRIALPSKSWAPYEAGTQTNGLVVDWEDQKDLTEQSRLVKLERYWNMSNSDKSWWPVTSFAMRDPNNVLACGAWCKA